LRSLPAIASSSELRRAWYYSQAISVAPPFVMTLTVRLDNALESALGQLFQKYADRDPDRADPEPV
jgi:hypothetical protein